MSRFLFVVLPVLVGLVACKPPPPEDTNTDPGFTYFQLDPAMAGRGTVVDVTMHADRSRFRFGDTQLSLGENITVDSVTVQDGFTAVATVIIDPDAELGPRDAAITIEGEDKLLPDAFTVLAQSLQIEPDNAKLGETLEVAIVGRETEWEEGYSWPDFGDGIDILDFGVISKTLATATIAVHPDTRPGHRDVSMENGPDVVTLYDGFQVDRAVITAVFDPKSAFQGQTVEFTVTGIDTSWNDSVTLEFWDDGGRNADIQVTELNVLDAQNMYGRMRLSNAARLGYRDVFIRGDEEDLLLPDAFEVLDAPPDLSNVAVGLAFDVVRQIDNATCELLEQVSAQAYFVIPLDPPCGPPPPMGMGPMPYDINGVFPSPPPSPEVDCPNPETVSAGDYVWFESPLNVVTLQKEIIRSTGQVIYVGRDLTLADYGFNQEYDLHTQGDPEGIPEVIVEKVQPTVPANWYLRSPDLCHDFTWDRTQTFEYEWDPAQTYPNAIFGTQISGTLVATGEGGFAGSIPWDDGIHAYNPGELTALVAGPVSFAAYSYIEGRRFGLPFSTIQTNKSDSVLQLGAQMILE